MDEELIQQVLAGKKELFGDLVRRYERLVYYCVSRNINDPGQIEDIVQETFMTAYNSLVKYEAGSSFKSWLISIAINKCRNFMRKKRLPITAMEPEISYDELNAKEELRIELLNAIKLLPEEMSLMLRLKFQEELKCNEIAKRLGKPIGTVVSQLSRAYKKLNETLTSFSEDKK